MWLLKLHFALSILCFITFVGFRRIYKQVLIDNGWRGNGKRKSDFELLAVCFVPIMNVIIVAALLTMLSMRKSDCEEMIKKVKEDE